MNFENNYEVTHNLDLGVMEQEKGTNKTLVEVNKRKCSQLLPVQVTNNEIMHPIEEFTAAIEKIKKIKISRPLFHEERKSLADLLGIPKVILMYLQKTNLTII